jgi:hypothetical protein
MSDDSILSLATTKKKMLWIHSTEIKDGKMNAKKKSLKLERNSFNCDDAGFFVLCVRENKNLPENVVVVVVFFQ